MRSTTCFICSIKIEKEDDENETAVLHSIFWKFAKDYMGIDMGETGVCETNQKKTFCDKCETAVGSISQLYLESLGVQLRISWSLGELAHLIEQSKTFGLTDYRHSLEDDNHRQLQRTLSVKCREKGSERLPFPDEPASTLEEEKELDFIQVQAITKKRGRKRKVESDDDDDYFPPEAASTLEEKKELDSTQVRTITKKRARGRKRKVEVESDNDDDYFPAEEDGEDNYEPESAGDGDYEPESDGNDDYEPEPEPDDDDDYEPEPDGDDDYEPGADDDDEDNDDVLTEKVKCDYCEKHYQKGPCLEHHLQYHERVLELEKCFPCDFCHKSFKLIESYERHLGIFHKGGFPCEEEGCEQQPFETKLQLNDHLKTTHAEMEKLNFCPICDLAFIDVNLLKLHQLRHIQPEELESHRGSKKSRIRRYSCPECAQTFDIFSKLHNHYNKEHGVRLKLVKCRYCEHFARSPQTLKTHQLVQHDQTVYDNFSCSDCGKIYENRLSLTAHRRNHHKELPCGVCNETLIGKRAKVAHMARAHPEEKKYQCPTCGKMFITESKMSSHLLVTHNEKRYSCPICDASFKSELFIKEHIAVIHNPQPNICQHCGKTYNSIRYLNRHLTDCHPELTSSSSPSLPYQKRYQCSNCSEWFQRVVVFRKHVLQCNPSTASNFLRECKICGKPLPIHIKMNSHLRTHMSVEEKKIDRQLELEKKGESMYPCQICGREFRCKDAYEAHCLKHAGLKGEIACDQCPKTFYLQKQLESHIYYKHQVSKTGVGMCRFPACNQQFPNTDLRKEHVQQCHSKGKEGIIMCHLCGKCYIEKNKKTLEKHVAAHADQAQEKTSMSDNRFTNQYNISGHFQDFNEEASDDVKFG